MQNRRTAELRRNWDLYVMILPVLAYYVIFHYWPMYGAQIAFRNFSAFKGIWASPWVGLKHFRNFASTYYFSNLIVNTLWLNILQLLVNMPLPIVLALSLNEIRSRRYKRVLQTVTYAPHFISTVVSVSLLDILFSYRYGILNTLLSSLGGEKIPFMNSAYWFRTIYVFSGAWQNTGWGAVIYIAALAAVSEELHEAAKIDGASRMQRIWHINLPAITPTALTLLILNCGRMMSIGFEKIFLLQNSRNINTSNVISTYVYSVGMMQGMFSYASAIGMFNSVINLILLLLVNWL